MKGKWEEAEMLFSMLNIQTGRGIQKGREVCDLFWTCVYVCVPGPMLWRNEAIVVTKHPSSGQSLYEQNLGENIQDEVRISTRYRYGKSPGKECICNALLCIGNRKVCMCFLKCQQVCKRQRDTNTFAYLVVIMNKVYFFWFMQVSKYTIIT